MKKTTLWLNYLRPNIFVRDVSQIDIHSLKVNGTKLIVCDLDNTLVPHFSKFPNKFVYQFLDKIKREGIDIVIASNNTKKRVTNFIEKLKQSNYNIDSLSNCKKPLSKKIKKYIKSKGYDFNDIAFVGDQFITDVFLANRLKSKSILVLPMVDPNRTYNTNFFIRILEKYLYKKLQHGNISVINNFNDELPKEDEYELL